MKRRIFTYFLLITTAQFMFSIPPKPPVGKRWVRNELFSDEFNGSKLDATKWYDYHPTWTGRAPGIFLPSQVKIANGFMSIQGKKLPKDTVVVNWDKTTTTYNIACGAVVSKTTSASFGYYECRMKAAETTMSSTFWMSSRNNTAGPKGCGDKYGLELDIQECIGRGGSFSGSSFANGMHSNAHFWYTDCGATTQQDLRATEVKYNTSPIPSQTFYTYGGWWRDESTASFYLNDNNIGNMTFYTGIKTKPFDMPMGLNMVSETYPFPWVSLPEDWELADNTKNTVYYDWVRAYSLVDVDKSSVVNPIVNGGFETGDLTGWGGYPYPTPQKIVSDAASVHSGKYAMAIAGPGSPSQTVNVKPNTKYLFSCYVKVASGSITLMVADGTAGLVVCKDASYTKKEVTFTSDATGKVRFYFLAGSTSDKGFIDDFMLTDLTPAPDPVLIYTEGVSLDKSAVSKPAAKILSVPFTFMANVDRELNLELRNADNVLVGRNTITAYAGYGNMVYDFVLDSVPAVRNKYKILVDIRPVGSDGTQAIKRDSLTVNLLPDGVTVLSEPLAVVTVYPNPVRDWLTLVSEREVKSYAVFGADGRMVQSGKVINCRVDVARLPKGVYAIKPDNGLVVRFVKI